MLLTIEPYVRYTNITQYPHNKFSVKSDGYTGQREETNVRFEITREAKWKKKYVERGPQRKM